MRIVQVSAHYPPNFVSGGTLVPQNIARSLANLGHESMVYAGHLDLDQKPLATWTEDDGEGVQVRWIVTTPWTGWADERNFDNNAVAADFEQWIHQTRPDVVHFHSLQSLGAGLVESAQKAGARVIVTMHDFWWFCARQFLVDKSYQPCSLVVECGHCPCEVDRPWLEQRNRYLAEQLSFADLILAPSQSAARVFLANGVPAEKLRVNENGLPETLEVPPPAVGEAPETGTVRFLFTGGADPMKGLPVLQKAMRLLDPDSDWSVSLYGTVPDDEPTPARASVKGRFLPAELADVMAAHDVLVLPSVMRESHSIVTREAMHAGLTVICSDTLGPEEVVDHGINGLVVPSADPQSLAAAMTRLINDGELLARLRAAGPANDIRPLSAQVDELVEIYSELVENTKESHTPSARFRTAAKAAADSTMRKVLFVVGIDGAPRRYRAELPAQALTSIGLSAEILHYRDGRVCETAATADAVIFYRVPATVQILELIEEIKRRPRPIPIGFDIDDLIFDPGLRGKVSGLSDMDQDAADLWWRGVARYRTTMEACDFYIGSTEELCRQVSRLTEMNTFRYPNGVGQELAKISESASHPARHDGPVRIGYFSGTTTHNEDWAMIEPAVLDALATDTSIELWLGGHLKPKAAQEVLGTRLHRLPMMDWTELPSALRDIDINLAPLVGGEIFNEAKSAIKWLEAALVATPTIASPTEPFREAIENGRTGILAETPAEWTEAILALASSPAERNRIGAGARRSALLELSPARQGNRYHQILLDAAAQIRAHGHRAANASGWIPVSDDEPFE